MKLPATSWGRVGEETCTSECGQIFWMTPTTLHSFCSLHTLAATRTHIFILSTFLIGKVAEFMNCSVARWAVHLGGRRCVSFRLGMGPPSFPKPPLVWTGAVLVLTHICVTDHQGWPCLTAWRSVKKSAGFCLAANLYQAYEMKLYRGGWATA